MKAFFVVLIIFVSGTVVLAQLPTNGLIAHYKFNKDLSQKADYVEDHSGKGNHGKMYGGVRYTKDRYHTDCSAMWFDGSGYVQVPSSTSLKSPRNAFTAAVWFKLANGADFFNQWITIMCKSDRFAETYNSPQYRMQATAQTVSINTEFTENFIPQLSYDVWYFYAYTYDGKKVKVYLDGKFVFEYYYSGALNANDFPLEIGRDLPGSQEYYYGAMDDLRIYNKALSEKELSQLYYDNSEANSPNRCLPPRPTPPQKDTTVIVQQDPPADPVDTATLVQKPLPPPPPVDTTTTPTPTEEEYGDLPTTINDIPIDYQQTVTVESRNITIYPYDNEKEDGDIVSINVNGEWVKDQYLLRKKVKNPAKNLFIKCQLNPGKNNYLLSKAWNLGSIGLNTLTVAIDDGTSVQEVIINSEEGLSGGIRIVCK